MESIIIKVSEEDIMDIYSSSNELREKNLALSDRLNKIAKKMECQYKDKNSNMGKQQYIADFFNSLDEDRKILLCAIVPLFSCKIEEGKIDELTKEECSTYHDLLRQAALAGMKNIIIHACASHDTGALKDLLSVFEPTDKEKK
jgi:hypothetical protein